MTFLNTAVAANYIGMVACLIGIFLRAPIVDRAREKVFFASVEQERYRSGRMRAVELTGLFLDRVYANADGSLSFKRVTIIAIVLNSLLFVAFLPGIAETYKKSHRQKGEVDLELIIGIAVVFVIFLVLLLAIEYASARMTLHFSQKARIHGRLRWLLIDFVLLIIIFYSMPVIALHVAGQQSLLVGESVGVATIESIFFVASPLFPLVLILQAEHIPLGVRSLGLPAVFSVCMPTAIFAFILSLCASDKGLHAVQFLMDIFSPKLGSQLIFVGTITISIACAYIANISVLTSPS